MGVAAEVTGWVGAVLVLAAYWLVTHRGTSILYHVLNILGAGGLFANALHPEALPGASLNLVWIAIACWGIRRYRRARRRAVKPADEGR